MGSFKGHVLPGSFFFATGLWWWINVLKLYYNASRRNISVSFKTTTWFPIPIKLIGRHPIEPLIRIFAGIIGIMVELFPNDYMLIDNDGEFKERSLNNFGHAAMYSIFVIWSVIEVVMFYNIVQLPDRSEFLFGALALFLEGILFYFHLDGRPKLDKLVHTFLYLVIFMTAAVMALEVWVKNSFLLMITRVFLILLQGTWFVQIAHSLHGSKPWDESLKSNQEFIGIAFAWHMIVLLILMVTGLVVLSLKANGCKRRNFQHTQRAQDDDMIEVENINGYDEDRRSLIEEERSTV